MLYQVFMAICLNAMAPKDCDIHNAVDWIAAPEPQLGLGASTMHGQEYMSNAGLLQPGKTYPKVYSVPPTRIGKANIG
jgi:hypothetical protein